jgi:DNA-binding transcriptional LysR family regulator
MSIQHVSLRQLRVFEAAASNRSFSKAAQLLHLTQPGVSMHIKELESNAGLPLFERLGKKLHVTEAGQELLARVREILRSLKDAEEAIDGLKGLKRGRINLAVVSTAKYFAPRLLARFGKDFPQLDIRLAVNNRDSVIEQLVANEVDLAIMGRSPQTLDTVAEPFAPNPHVIIAAPDHPLAGVRRVSADRVARETFIVREPGSGTRLASGHGGDGCELHFQTHPRPRAANREIGDPRCERHTRDPGMARRAFGEEAPVADRRGVQALRAHPRTVFTACAGCSLGRRPGALEKPAASVSPRRAH